MISVCMATFNGEKYIEEQLHSILKQLDAADEVVISDDGSNDETLNIIKRINDSRIRVIFNNNMRGYTSNFYNALRNAKGDHIFLADQDDVWMDNKVKVTMEYLKNYDFVVSNSKEVDENLHVIDGSRFDQYNIKKGFYHTLCRSRYIGCCMAFNKIILEAIFPVPTYSNEYPHDIWIPLVAERYFETAIIEEPLLLYRRHGENISNGGDDSDGSRRSLLRKVYARFYYFKYILRQQKQIKKIKKEKDE